MDLGLAGKVAIVTGGSKGIGKAIAQELAGEGVDVAICARDRRVLEEAAKTLAAATRRRIVPIVCDTTSTKSVQDLVEATVAQLGRRRHSREQCVDAGWRGDGPTGVGR